MIVFTILRRLLHLCGLTPKQALGVYLYKHMSAVFNYIKSNGQSESEPIQERIKDVINYMLLFALMIEEEKPVDGSNA
jgi:hypothetical protein